MTQHTAPSLVLRQAKLTLSMALLLSLAGVVSWLRMPRMEDPEIPPRNSILVTVYPGADPETVERLVAEPIEDRLAEIDDLDTVESTIRAEVVITRIELRGHLNDEVEIENVWDEVRRKVALAREEFPRGVPTPRLDTEILETESVLLAVTGSGDRLDLMAAAERVKKRLLSLDLVSKVLFSGDPGDQITIEYDDALARRLDIGPAMLARQLRARGSTTPGGSLHLGQRSVILRPFAEFTSLEEIRRAPVVLPSGASVPLSQVATVRRGPSEPKSERMRLDGIVAVAMGVVPRDDINLLDFGDTVRAEVEKLRQEVAPLVIHEVTFQPQRVAERLAGLGQSLLLGMGIVAALLVAFMGPRLGLIVASVVPLVAAAAVALYNAGGGILQQMSIAALVIALGLLVDNAIVVAEAVQWHIDRGTDNRTAAMNAIRELWVPLLAATGTTLAAFVPMLLAVGNVGNFTRAIPQVIMLTLGVSYFFAVFVTPVLSARFLRPRRAKGTDETAFDRFTRRLSSLSTMRPARVLAGVGVLVVLSGLGILGVHQQFFPAADRNQLLVNLELPEGSHLDATDTASRLLEEALLGRTEVVSAAAFVGRSSPHFYYNLPRKPQSPHLAQVLVTTRAGADLDPLSNWIRSFAGARLPEILVTTRVMEQGPPIDAAVEVRLYNEDWRALKTAADQVLTELRAIPGALAPRHDVGQGLPTVRFAIDDAAAARHQLARAHVAQALVGQTRGLAAGQMRYADDPVPIVVRAAAGEKLPVDRLATLDVAGAAGDPVPLSQVARFEAEWVPAVIHHAGRRRVVTVSADLPAGLAFSEVMSKLKPRLSGLELPAGTTFELGGAEEASKEANSAIMAKMPYTALLLVFILLAEFKSYRRVLIVMVTIPLAATGVVPGLLLAGQPFGFMSLLGVLALAGIVVNNAIVLIEVIEARRSEGKSLDTAIRAAVAQRTRPILLTTATTVAGLMPLAFSSASLWPPLAWSMISGLLTSTALTLLAVPSLYRILFSNEGRTPSLPSPSGRGTGSSTVLAAAAVLMLTALVSAPSYADPRQITLEEAMDAAAQRQELAAARADEEAARQDAATVRRLGLLPQVEASAGYRELSEARELETPLGALELGDKGTTFARLGVRQPLIDVATRRHLSPAAEMAADARGHEARRVHQRLAAEAGLAFIQVLRIDANLETTRAFIRSLDGRSRQVRGLVDEGRSLKADLLKVNLDRDDAKLEEYRLQQLRKVALEDFRRAMGAEEAAEPFFDSAFLPSEIEDRDSAAGRAWSRRPDLQALDAQAEALRRQAKGVRAETLPRLDARLSWEYLEPSSFTEDSFVEGTLAVTWKPFASGTRKTRSASLEASGQAVEARLAEARRMVDVEMLAALADFDTAHRAIKVRESDVRQAEETLRVESERYTSGRSTLDDVLEYEAILRQRKTLRELAELDVLASWIRYRLATGGL